MIPILETSRLILRAPTLDIVESYQRNFVDYEVIRHLAHVPWPYPSDGVIQYLQNEIMPKQGKDYWAWGIFLKGDPKEMIGSIILWRQCNPANRGFWLGRTYWGQGYMTEAAEAVTAHAFESLNFHRLVFENAVGNTRSARVKEKQGCTRIERRPFRFVNPAYTEMEIWELTKESWLKGRAPRHP